MATVPTTNLDDQCESLNMDEEQFQFSSPTNGHLAPKREATVGDSNGFSPAVALDASFNESVTDSFVQIECLKVSQLESTRISATCPPADFELEQDISKVQSDQGDSQNPLNAGFIKYASVSDSLLETPKIPSWDSAVFFDSDSETGQANGDVFKTPMNYGASRPSGDSGDAVDAIFPRAEDQVQEVHAVEENGVNDISGGDKSFEEAVEAIEGLEDSVVETPELVAQPVKDTLLEKVEKAAEFVEEKLAEALTKVVDTVEEKIAEAVEEKIGPLVEDAIAGAMKERIVEAVEQKVEDKISEAVEAKMEDVVETEVEEKVEIALEEKVEAEIEAKVEAEIEAKIEAKIEAEIEVKIEAAVEARIEAAMEAKIEAALEAKIEDAVNEKIKESEFEEKVKDLLDGGIVDAVTKAEEAKIIDDIEQKVLEQIEKQVLDFLHQGSATDAVPPPQQAEAAADQPAVSNPAGNEEEQKSPALPETVTHITSKEGVQVYIVGTAHFSLESQEDVARTILAVRPRVVMVELCVSRLNILRFDEQTILEEAQNLNLAKIRSTLKQYGAVQGALYLLFLSTSAHLTRQLGMAPGGEFRRAYHEARNVAGCRIHLGDRPIHVTLHRALAALSLWQKIKLVWHLLLNRSSISPEEVERCKKKDLLEEMLEEMTGEFPALSRVFVQERDLCLAHTMQLAAADAASEARSGGLKDPPAVVGVVGIGHVAGMVNYFGNVTEKDVKKVMQIPPRSMQSRLFILAFKLSMAGCIAYGCYKVVPKLAPKLQSNLSSLHRAIFAR